MTRELPGVGNVNLKAGVVGLSLSFAVSFSLLLLLLASQALLNGGRVTIDWNAFNELGVELLVLHGIIMPVSLLALFLYLFDPEVGL